MRVELQMNTICSQDSRDLSCIILLWPHPRPIRAEDGEYRTFRPVAFSEVKDGQELKHTPHRVNTSSLNTTGPLHVSLPPPSFFTPSVWRMYSDVILVVVGEWLRNPPSPPTPTPPLQLRKSQIATSPWILLSLLIWSLWAWQAVGVDVSWCWEEVTHMCRTTTVCDTGQWHAASSGCCVVKQSQRPYFPSLRTWRVPQCPVLIHLVKQGAVRGAERRPDSVHGSDLLQPTLHCSAGRSCRMNGVHISFC